MSWHSPDFALSVNFTTGHDKSIVLAKLPEIECTSEFESAAQFKVPTATVRLSEVFRIMEGEIAGGDFALVQQACARSG